jgi:pimeloyl-ACP methyl ester carboxylesterase
MTQKVWAGLIVSVLAWPLSMYVTQPIAAAQTASVSLPFEMVDSLDGAPFKIRVPGNWNGTLLVYLQGTKVAGASAEAPVVPPVLKGPEAQLEQTLLSQGYALAGSLVSTADWQARAEFQDTFALLSYFKGRVGQPKRVIALGTSLGGLLTLKLMEEFPRSFDAGIATCSPAAGMPLRMDRTLDFAVAYDAVFGWQADKWGPIGDLKEGINFARDVNPVVPWPKADGSNRGAWEFIRLIAGSSSDAFWVTDPAQGYPGYFLQMLWTTQQREAVEMWAMGPVTQNLDHHYSLTPEDKAYLNGLGVKADDLLTKMNAAPPIPACTRCRDYAYRFATVRGALTKPVITLHVTGDGLADISNEGWYRDAVASWGATQYLSQAYVNGVGHCAFTATQILTTVAAMEKWLDTGVKPDATAFPETQGFTNSFVPPAWPWPY